MRRVDTRKEPLSKHPVTGKRVECGDKASVRNMKVLQSQAIYYNSISDGKNHLTLKWTTNKHARRYFVYLNGVRVTTALTSQETYRYIKGLISRVPKKYGW